MSDTINDPAQIEAAFERDQEAEDSRPAAVAIFLHRSDGSAARIDLDPDDLLKPGTVRELPAPLLQDGPSTSDPAPKSLSSNGEGLGLPPAAAVDLCACFPGTCRGGEVINGRTAGGMRCRRTDTKAERDKVDERLAVGLLRAEYGERAGYLARRLEEVAGRFRGVDPLQAELRESAKILRVLAP